MGSVDSYIFYDPDYVPDSFGLYNTGAICWFNSLIQSMFSLPAFNSMILTCETEVSKSALGKAYIDVLKDLLVSERRKLMTSNDLNQISQKLIRGYVVEARAKGVTIDLQGQEGPANGLVTFLDLLGSNEIYKVLNNKYEMIAHCNNCNKDISIENDKWHLIQMYFVRNPPQTKESFEKYIKGHLTPLEGYKCETCKTLIANKYRYERLLMLRECIIITFEKSKREKYFPKELDFLSRDNKMLRYRIVAQIEHSGNYSYEKGQHKSSGHYYTRTMRGDYNWHVYNDQSVTQGSCENNSNVHIVMYHLFEHSDLTDCEKAAIEKRRIEREAVSESNWREDSNSKSTPNNTN